MYPVIELGSIRLPSYLLIISLTYCVCLVWIVKRCEKQSFSRNAALDFCLAIMVGGFLGARLLHVIWEAPGYYIQNPLNIIKIWQGGFVFFGGVVGAFLASELVFRRNPNLDRGTWQDLFTPLFPLGYAIGRLSCLAAGCCYGRPTSLPWGIIFPSGVEATPHLALHPTQIYAFLWEINLFFIILLLEKKRPSRLSPPGSLFLVWLIGHAIGRFLMEAYRADDRGASVLGLSISSALSVVLFLAASIILFFRQKNWKLYVDTSTKDQGS